MAKKLIRLQDGILVEAEVPDDQLQQIAGGGMSDRTINDIKPLLIKAITPITECWRELNDNLSVGEVQVEIGLGFEAEGNVFIAKGKTNASLTISLTLKPKN